MTKENEIALMRRVEQLLHVYDDDAARLIRRCMELGTDRAAITGIALAEQRFSAEKYGWAGKSSPSEQDHIEMFEAEAFAAHFLAVRGR